jgi:hypothetical protein
VRANSFGTFLGEMQQRQAEQVMATPIPTGDAATKLLRIQTLPF